MLSESIQTALNWQLNHEQTNAQIYLMFSAIADYLGLPGATSWFLKQSDEERAHANKIFKYICDQGGVPHLLAIPEQLPEISSLEQLMARALETEVTTTNYLKTLATMCRAENDDQTYTLMQAMLTEQIEEEKNTGDALRQIQYSANNIMIIDKILGER